MEQIPLSDGLLFRCEKAGEYTFEFPQPLRVGMVTSGGLQAAAAQKAAQHFAHHDLQLSSNVHLLQSSVYYFRPVFSSPKKTHLTIQLVNSSKVWTTVIMNMMQDEKVCTSGFLTLSDLTLPGSLSAPTSWSLSPTPRPVSLSSLEADEDPDWVSYRTPFTSKSIRNVAAYIVYHVPIHRLDNSFVDQWVTPGWEDPTRPDGAVWTNDMIQFLTDHQLPHWHNHVGADVVSYCRYDAIVAAGLEQRQLRKDGKDDRIFGKNCGPLGPVEWVSSTVTMSTEIRKLLPAEGVKWLFMRAITIKLEDSRLTEHVYLLDAQGGLVAITTQHVHCVPMTVKAANKNAKI